MYCIRIKWLKITALIMNLRNLIVILSLALSGLSSPSAARAAPLIVEAGQTHTDAVIEVDRYIGMPGQALCYMIGMIEIEKAREVASRDPNFSLRDFHDRVLAVGQLPLPSFRRVFGTD